MKKAFTVCFMFILCVFNGGLSFAVDHAYETCQDPCSSENVSCGHSENEHHDPMSGKHAHDCVHTHCQHGSGAMIFFRWDAATFLSMNETRLSLCFDREVSDQSFCFRIEKPPKL